MAQVLGFIKTHLITLVSGIVIIASVVVATMGMGADSVVAEMQKEKSRIGADRISSFRSDPKNEAIIEAEEQRVAAYKEEYEATVKLAEQINQRKPLMEGVFPQPDSLSTPLKFVEVYRKRLEQLPRRLQAGTLPTEDEIAEEIQNVEDLITLEAEQDTETAVDGGRTPTAPSRSPSAGMRPGAMRPGMGMQPGGAMRPGTGMQPGGAMRPGTGMQPGGAMRPGMGMQPGGAMRPGGAPFGQSTPSAGSIKAPTDEPKYNAVYRARVNKALSIYTYIEPYIPGTRISQTFHISPILNVTSAPPTEEMWFAQMTLWVQEDVLKAINDLNNRMAAGSGDATVADVPVKRLKSVEVEGYILPKSSVSFPGLRTSRATTSEGTFTDRKANDLYDVVRYTIVAVVDQRAINQLVDEIGKVNFTQCVGMQYFAIDRAADEQGEGYFYGPAPVVEVVLDFEAYYLRTAYQEMMPETVRTMLGIKE